jgi:small subunit ribosomal protein S16
VVAINSRNHREGRTNEVLGHYDPLKTDNNLTIKLDRVHAWVNNGAELMHSVESLIRFSGLQPFPEGYAELKTAQKAKKKAKWAKRKKKPGDFVPASRRAIKKHQAKIKAARMAESKAADDAKAAAAAKAAEAEAAAAAAETPAEETAPAENSES